MFWNPEGLLTDPQSLNSYSYARNNPIVFVDANGNIWGWPEWGSFLKGAAIGAGTAIVIAAGIGAVAFFSPIIATTIVVGLGVYAVTEIGSVAYVSAVKNNWDMGGVANDFTSWVSDNPEDVGNIVGGVVGCSLACKGAAEAGAKGANKVGEIVDEMITRYKMPNYATKEKLGHIFDNPMHKLDGILDKYGSKEKAFLSLQEEIEKLVSQKGISGVYEETVNLGSQDIVVRGKVLDNGEVRIGTAFIK